MSHEAQVRPQRRSAIAASGRKKLPNVMLRRRAARRMYPNFEAFSSGQTYRDVKRLRICSCPQGRRQPSADALKQTDPNIFQFFSARVTVAASCQLFCGLRPAAAAINFNENFDMPNGHGVLLIMKMLLFL
jgi:hypothetical protein